VGLHPAEALFPVQPAHEVARDPIVVLRKILSIMEGLDVLRAQIAGDLFDHRL
jgi:hypothetical protein